MNNVGAKSIWLVPKLYHMVQHDGAIFTKIEFNPEFVSAI